MLASVHIASMEAWPEAAEHHVSKALEATQVALSIDASHCPSLVDRAEAHAAAAKLARSSAGGAASEAQEHWVAACRDYQAALRQPAALGSCSERCTVRYNYACALAQCGERDAAVQVLLFIGRKDSSALSGAARDVDLDLLRGVPQLRAVFAQSAV